MDNKLEIIGYINTPFKEKFGIPRQSGMVEGMYSTIRFSQKYKNINALRGLEGFSHIWVLWGFSKTKESVWSPTVRPPRLGGNKKVGVFATRSPNRPNKIGLSSLKLIKITNQNNEISLIVEGADMLDGSPIYDIKPYIPFTDSHQDATLGFTESYTDYKLKVICPQGIRDEFDEKEYKILEDVLSLDPRPSYQNDPERIYGVSLFGKNIKFLVKKDELTIVKVENIE